MTSADRLDADIKRWWDEDLRASPQDGPPGTDGAHLLAVPFPYVTPGGADGPFGAMFAWDTYFINRGLLAHDRLDLVEGHIHNYLSLVDRYGHMPNSNVSVALTRSQTPVFPDSVWRHLLASGDEKLLERAYPLLAREFHGYWNAPHHRTPIGLATNRDLGDAYWPPDLAAEAETGLDWTPIYGSDVRRCVPLVTNCALIRYADTLAAMADALGRLGESARFRADADRQRDLVNRYCWDEPAGVYLEYDHVAGARLPYISACAYWPLWAGVPSPERARRLVATLRVLEQPHGLSTTDRAYPDPHRPGAYPDLSAAADAHTGDATRGGGGQLQWMYPAGWAPLHLIAVDGLDAYGFHADADRIATAFLGLVLHHYERTGRLWEKYDVVDGTLTLPNSRYGNVPMHGWTAGAAAVFLRRTRQGAHS
ncbi:trehalase family glycosidase [Phytohabitans kaempferiae]|uniref:Trehalase family glycosidase n=1 Tax=Phytohabitans kaempferiae TaxID=1620943 RepID=A0ABV6M9P2_9ACTN